MMMNEPTPTRRTMIGRGVIWLFLGIIPLGLSACGGTPYIDSRREAGLTGMIGTSTPDRVAICYSSSSTTPQELLKLAESECAKTGRSARFSHQERVACNLSNPTRAYFNCVTKP